MGCCVSKLYGGPTARRASASRRRTRNEDAREQYERYKQRAVREAREDGETKKRCERTEYEALRRRHVEFRIESAARRNAAGKCERFVQEECVLSPRARAHASEFMTCLYRYMNLDVFPGDHEYDGRSITRDGLPSSEWWKERFGISMPRWGETRSGSFVHGVRLRRSGDVESGLGPLRERLEKLEQRTNEIYWAPGMPGYVGCKDRFVRSAS